MPRQSSRSRAPPIPILGRRNDVRSLISHFEERSKYPHLFTPTTHHHHHHTHAEPLPTPNTVRVLVDCFNRMVAAISMRPIRSAAIRLGSSNSSTGYQSQFSVHEPTMKRCRSTNTISTRGGSEWKLSQPILENQTRRGKNCHPPIDPLSPKDPLKAIAVSRGGHREKSYHSNSRKGKRRNYGGVERSSSSGSVSDEPEGWVTPSLRSLKRITPLGQPVEKEQRGELPEEGRRSRTSARPGSPYSYQRSPRSMYSEHEYSPYRKRSARSHSGSRLTVRISPLLRPLSSPASSASYYSYEQQFSRPGSSIRMWKDGYPPPSSRANRSPDHFHSLGRSSKYSGDKDMLDPDPVPRVILTPPPHPRFLQTPSPHENIMVERDNKISRILDHYEKMERAASPSRSDHSSRLPGVNLQTGRVVGTGEIVDISVSHLKDHFEPTRRWDHEKGNRPPRLPNVPRGRRSHTDFHQHKFASNESREMEWQRKDRDTGKSRQSPMPGTFPSCLEMKDSIHVGRPAITRNNFNHDPGRADNIPYGTDVNYTTQPHDSSSSPRTYLDIALAKRRARSSGSFTSADTIIKAQDVPPSPYQSFRSHRRSPSSRRSRHNRSGSSKPYPESSFEKSKSPQHGNSDSSSDEESRKRTPHDPELHGSNYRPPSPIRSPGLMVQLGILPLERRASLPSQQYDVPRMRIRPDNTWLRHRHPVDILDPPLLRRSNRSPHQGSMDGVSDVGTSPRTLIVTTVISSGGEISGPYHQPKFQSMNIFPDHDAFGQLHDRRVHLEHSQSVHGRDENEFENAIESKNNSLAEQRSTESMATALEIQSQGFDDQESLSASLLFSSQSFDLRLNPASKTSSRLYSSPDRRSTSVKSDKLRARYGTPYSNESNHSHPRFQVSPSTPSSAVSAENDKQHQFALLIRSHSREGRDSAQIRLRRIDEKSRNGGKGKDKKRLGWMKWL